MGAELCPVCWGKGRLADGKGDRDSAFAETCHGCGGKGWVTVQEHRSMPPFGSPFARKVFDGRNSSCTLSAY